MWKYNDHPAIKVKELTELMQYEDNSFSIACDFWSAISSAGYSSSLWYIDSRILQAKYYQFIQDIPANMKNEG